METFVALIRAANVGGTGKLPMSDLRARCEQCGFLHVRTLQAAGNVVFTSGEDESGVKRRLEDALAYHTGRMVGVLVRTGKEMARVLAANPFPQEPGNRTVAIFLEQAPPPDLKLRGQKDEQVQAGQREIYVFYPAGQGQSKLTIPAASNGTARNMNTIAKLVEMTC
ncbi:MAG: DUF1697 domain-containing protein [Candidatus Xenobia bacterium]